MSGEGGADGPRAPSASPQPRNAERRTTSGIPLKDSYGPDDLAGWDPAAQLGAPGSFPFTRGIYDQMYRRRVWTFRQYAGYGDARATNERFRFLHSNGQRGLSLAFDLPTQLGLDSDDPETLGEVGRLGVAIDTVEDMKQVYDGIPLTSTSTSMTINATAPVLLAMYVVAAEEQGVEPAVLQGTVQNDVFKEYLARGLYVFPPEASLRLSCDVIEYCVRAMPRFNPVSVSAPHIRSAGALYVDALAYMFCAASLMVEELVRRGLKADEVGPRISFLAGADNDFFETVCRHRASRRLWARLMAERFGACDPKAQQYRLAGSGNPLNLTRERPLNNIARIALHGLANVLGGCQSLVLPCWDEAYTIPTEDAVRTSLDIQAILAYETGITSVVDPLAGSYFVESLTDEIENAIAASMAEVEKMGGLVAAIDDGWIQRDMALRAFRQEQAIASGEFVMVGVNRNQDAPGEGELDVEGSMHAVDPASADDQRARLADVRASRDAVDLANALSALEQACRGTGNVMEPVIEAVRRRATVGEITAVMTGVWGRYRAPSPL